MDEHRYVNVLFVTFSLGEGISNGFSACSIPAILSKFLHNISKKIVSIEFH